jgi:hypothetical protein
MNTTMNTTQKTISLTHFAVISAGVSAFLVYSLAICTLAGLAYLTPISVGAVGAGYRCVPVASVNIQKQIATDEPTDGHYARGAVVGGVQVEATESVLCNDGRGVVTDIFIHPKQVRLKSFCV